MNRIAADAELNALALVKGEEKYIFVFGVTCEDRAGILKAMGRFASDPDLSFTWADMATLCPRVRATAKLT